MSKSVLKTIVDELVRNDNHELAHQLIDHYYKKATTPMEFDGIGASAIAAKYFEMQLKCALAAYTVARGEEGLFAARENLYKAYMTMNYPDKALFYIDLNLKMRPNDFQTTSQRAFALAQMCRREESEQILMSLVGHEEQGDSDLDYALSGKMIREGHTAKGIRNFITAFKPKNPLFEDQLQLEFWSGQIEPGRTIVINGEGGVGDEIINIRFLNHIRDLGMTPILYSSWYRYRPDLTDLFRRHGYRVETNSMFFKSDWMWTHMMALPAYLNLNEDQLWSGPYLTPQRLAKNQLNDTKFKIGIKCNGNPYFEQDIFRRIPIEEIIQAIPDNVSIYYFDKEKTADGTISLKDKLDTWEDTLDYIDQMDLILSSCTSLVHAAGAIGKRTIVVTPIAEYYTWTSTRINETTPWYGDNFTVLKQTKLRSWKEPLQRASEIIQQMLK